MRRAPLLAILAFLALVAPLEAQQYDVLITGGRIIDGTGAPAFAGDVAIRGDRIVAVARGRLPADRATRVVDVAGLVVTPGFIDLHAHLEPLLRMPDAESHVRQGVTTAIGNPDGGGSYPIGEYLSRVEQLPLGMNVGFFVGHNTVRRQVMGLADRDPTPEELASMKEMIARGMGEGAFGISTGLFYLPGTFSKLEEVVELAKAAADSGGIYTSHLRKEGIGLPDGVAEAIEIGRRARLPITLTHHKAIGPRMRGASATTIAMMDSARAAGVDVMADQYPYTATSTGLGALVPPWAQEGGDSAFTHRVRDPALRDSIKAGIVWNLINDRGGGDLRRVQFSGVSWMPELEGKTLADWAAMKGLEPTPENGAELVIEGMLKGGASMIYHVLDEGDVERIMRYRWTMIASDGRLSRPGEDHPHPRAYGTFPRVLGLYVREKKVLALEDAVRKMTALPAWRIGLQDRGRIAEGMVADLAVLDPVVVADKATFAEPHQYPDGIRSVIVNGVVVVEEGRFTAARAGKVLRRPAGRRQTSEGPPPAP